MTTATCHREPDVTAVKTNLHVSSHVVPRSARQDLVPFSLRDKVREKLQRLEDIRVLERVQH